MTRTVLGIAAVAAGLTFVAPAHANVDTDFADELHTYGIYGQKDYNAWIGKIVCKRLRNGRGHRCDEVGSVHLHQSAKRQHHRAGVAIPWRRAAHILSRPHADPGTSDAIARATTCYVRRASRSPRWAAR